jgi:UDP:flavonoid glycosyltransferase YjiC (YdhE family)
MMRPLLNESRGRVLHLPPLSRRYYWQVDSPRSEVPFIYGFSPSVVPRPANWGPAIQIAGYWFLDESQDYEPPAALLSFLDAGPPPVYVGFGSMVDHERETMTRLVAEAVGLAGQRAILLSGWSELGAANLPDFIFQVASVPHDWLFPRVAAVVHHGGAGTTAAGLRAGKPTVVVPFFADQAFWAWRVHQLSAGPKWIPRKRLTAGKLAAAIRRAVNDAAIRERASDLGERIRAEDGMQTAVGLIEQFAAMDRKPP